MRLIPGGPAQEVLRLIALCLRRPGPGGRARACSLMLLAALLVSQPSAGAPEPAPFVPGRAGFSARFAREVNPYRVLAAFVLPGEEIPLEIEKAAAADSFAVTVEAGVLARKGPRRWVWHAPAAIGLHRLRIERLGGGSTMNLNVFVMVPRDRVRDGWLNGYRIGSYPSRPYKDMAIYKPPRGFVEVTPENADTPVSPHFTLRQFLCQQESGWPRYLVLRARLLLKLELVLERTNASGYRCDSFAVMSGYRTPFYNAAIGNVKYSRHVWGGAADIFIDESPRDGVMDDLNRDGVVDFRDAAILYDIVDGLFGRAFYEPFLGGLGRYRRTAAHGPFVHVDVRGFRARWGE
jgi:hypothetical protein